MDADLIRVALNRKQLSDFVERESELLRLLYKLEVRYFVSLIEAVPALRSRRRRQQSRLFIEPDGVNSQGGSFCDFGKLQRSSHRFQAYSLDLTSEARPDK